LTGDQDYIQAIGRIWEDVVSRKLYLTGNVGQHGAGEGYAGAYQLTNVRAYNETCAAIALAQGWQLAQPVKLIGISTADVLAAQLQADGVQGPVHLVFDAQRGEFYVGTWELSVQLNTIS